MGTLLFPSAAFPRLVAVGADQPDPLSCGLSASSWILITAVDGEFDDQLIRIRLDFCFLAAKVC